VILYAHTLKLCICAAIQAWAVICSLVSVAWSLTSYHRSVRYARDDKEKLEWQGAVMQFCWHLMSTGNFYISNIAGIRTLTKIEVSVSLNTISMYNMWR
jgi:hypothetical protein